MDEGSDSGAPAGERNSDRETEPEVGEEPIHVEEARCVGWIEGRKIVQCHLILHVAAEDIGSDEPDNSLPPADFLPSGEEERESKKKEP